MIHTKDTLTLSSVINQISANSNVSAKIAELVLTEIVKINDASSVIFTGRYFIRYES
jgi:hypothetical protein